MGEVDQAQYAVDQRVTQGNQRINRAESETVKGQAPKCIS